MESIINQTLVEHLNSQKLLSDKQFGFSRGKSCATQLLYCKDKWSRLLDSKKSIDIAYIDFQKAFDSVVHSKLVSKFRLFGIEGFLMKWLTEFLRNRSQKVKINFSFSDSLPVTSGVPQGSVLGPTLFNMYINDIISCVENSEILLFADDVKVFSCDPKQLEKDLVNIHEWSVKWQLSISSEKCNILHLGKKNPKNTYFLNGMAIKSEESIKDLGVFMTEKFSSSLHCTHLFKKCSQISSLIVKSFLSRNRDLMLRAYKVYVIPLLDYCSTVYSPHKVADINLLERVQRRFTKNILRNSSLSYNERLELLGLQRLEVKRIHNDLCLAYKMIHGETPGLNILSISENPLVTRSSDKITLSIDKFSLDLRKFDFACRTSKFWNFLPQNAINCKNLKIFREKLLSLKFSMFLKGRD
jgi:ribonucleases P/MRP protein subunit RPP40